MGLWWFDIQVSNVWVFIKQVFLLVRKLSTQVGLILLKHSDIRLSSSWSSSSSFSLGSFGKISHT